MSSNSYILLAIVKHRCKIPWQRNQNVKYHLLFTLLSKLQLLQRRFVYLGVNEVSAGGNQNSSCQL